MILAFMMTLVFIPTFSFASYAAEEDSITVFLTVSDQGTLAKDNNGEAMAWRDVTVTDLDGDGHYTFDEVLVAAHEMYNSADGYAKTSGGQVTKLWGTETSNTLFFINHEGLSTGVTADTVSDGDYCVASINADQTYYADWYTFFDQSSATVSTNEEITLTLSGHLGMAWTNEDKANVPTSGVEVKDAEGNTLGTTDEDGNVTLSFDEPGMYTVTATGTTAGAAYDFNLMNYKTMDSTVDGTAFVKFDWDTFDSFVAYTEEYYGNGPYPASEIKYIDFMEEAAEDSESDYAWEDLNYLTSNQVITDCPIMAPACVVTVDPAPLDYDGEEVNFIKEDGGQFGMWTPMDGTTVTFEDGSIIIHYVPKNTTVYAGFRWGTIALPEYADESAQPEPDITVNEDGTIDMAFDVADGGKAYPIAVIKHSFSKGSWTSADQYYLAIPKAKTGWIKEDSEWYYYKDGEKLTNGWAKDSTGWCYMDANGKITKNKWIKDKDEWYFLKSNGYMAANEWAKDSGGWMWMNASGKITKNKWIKDKGEWYFLKSNGYMAANEWAKDSGGWMWMNASGKITKNKWIKDKGEWYFLKSNGYMAANEWAKDSGGWMYMNGSGKVTKSQWIKDGGSWYYLKANGYMATGTQTINGKTYRFASSGKWID